MLCHFGRKSVTLQTEPNPKQELIFSRLFDAAMDDRIRVLDYQIN